MLVATRFLFFCTVVLLLTSLVPAAASTGSEAIRVSPLVGRPGQPVTVTGTGWREHGARGIDVPIWIGFANTVARGRPDVTGKFTVSFNMPSTIPEGEVVISAIIGNGGSADALYINSATGCVDVYFIGLHGVGQGPDNSEDMLATSQEVEETGRNFKALKPQNKTVAVDSLVYHAPLTWNLTEIVQGEIDAVDALDKKLTEVFANCKTPNMSTVLVGYSFGAWVIDKWISSQQAKVSAVLAKIRAVVLYGDPFWQRETYGGLVRRWGRALYSNTKDPYQIPVGYTGFLANRWQSLCLANDPVCGEGYTSDRWPIYQLNDAIQCDSNFCEHQKYALYPKPNKTGYGSTKGGADFLASQALK